MDNKLNFQLILKRISSKLVKTGMDVLHKLVIVHHIKMLIFQYIECKQHDLNMSVKDILYKGQDHQILINLFQKKNNSLKIKYRSRTMKI